MLQYQQLNIIMIKIAKLCRLSNLRCLAEVPKKIVYSGLLYDFSISKKKTQLILHTENELTKLHNKKNNKGNQWKTVRQQRDSQFRVSLIGLPNSGKSTLFNCIIGQHLAIVDNLPGMTRDRREFTIMDGLVKVIDTPGVEVSLFGKKQKQSIKNDIFKQTVTSIHESDLIIVVIDSTKPISNDEAEMVKYLRKFTSKDNLILACNKTQKLFDQSLLLTQVSNLGIEKIFYCSGLEGTGIFQILQHIDKIIPNEAKQKLRTTKIQRVKKFQELIKRLKQQMQGLEAKGINIKQWEQDFRKINPNPEINSDLDYQQFQQYLIRPQASFSSNRGAEIKNLKMKNTIKICFIGRPNVGKSSLINEILGEQRLVVSETAHTTRDSIPNKIIYKNRKIELIDTAGLDNHNIQKNEQEYIKKVQYSTILHIKQSHIVVYVMDAFSAFKVEDFRLIRDAIEEGRPILIVVNKWEAIKQEYKYKAKNYLFKQIDQNLGHLLHGHPVVFVSAKMNDGLDTMIDSIINTYDKWNTRISTGMLNNWLEKFKKLDNLPKDSEATLRINYLIQARVRPPHFIFFVNNKKLFKDNYMRFLTENIAKEFKMDGIPLRVTLRSTNNRENKHNTKAQKQPKKVSPMKQKMDDLKKKYNNFGL